MKVTINHSENLHFIAQARHFEDIHVDEPISFHGNDNGPSPVEYMLISISSCLGSTFMYCLQKQQVEIKDLTVVIDGKLKHSGSKMRLRVVNLDAELSVTPKNNDSIKEIESCILNFQEFCIISNIIDKNIPFDVKVSIKK